MLSQTNHPRNLLLASILALGFTTASHAQQTYTWNGSESSNGTDWDYTRLRFNNPDRSNWSLNGSNSSTTPDAGDTAVFPSVTNRFVGLNSNPSTSVVQITSADSYTFGQVGLNQLLTVTPGNFEVTAGSHIFNGGLSFGNTPNSTATMDIAAGATLTQSGNLLGLGSQTVIKDGDGNWVLTGNVLHAGTLQVADGSINLDTTTQLSSLTELILSSGATLSLNGGTAEVGELSGAGVLNLNGGTFAISQDSTFQGRMSIFQPNSVFKVTNGATYTHELTTGGSSNDIATLNPDDRTLTFDVGANSTANIEVAINTGRGTGSLFKTGTGTMSLSSNLSNYRGGTYIDQGILQISSVSNTVDGEASSIGNGSFVNEFRIGSDATFGELEFTGSTDATNRAIQIGDGGATIDITTESTTLSLNGVISNDDVAGAILKAGSGTLELTGNNSFSGSFSLTDGKVIAGSNTALGTGNVLLGDGELELVDGISLANNLVVGVGDLSVPSGTVTMTGVVSGLFDFNKFGSGELSMTGASSLAAKTVIQEGALRISGADERLPDNYGVEVYSGAELIVDGIAETILRLENRSGTVSLINGGSLAVGGGNDLSTFSGTITGSGTFIKEGTGGVTLLSANTFTGGLTVNGGFVRITNDNNLGGPSNVVTLNNGSGLSLGSDTSSSRNIVISSGFISVDPLMTYTHSGVLSGSGALQKSGVGTLDLSGANTFSGEVQVHRGTLKVSNSSGSGTGSGAVTVDSGATLAGTGTVSGATTVNSGARLAPGASAGTLSFGGDLTLDGILEAEIDGATADQVNVGGTLDLTDATLSISEINAPTADSYVLASATTITGSFSSISGVPTGYVVDIYNNQVLLARELTVSGPEQFVGAIDGSRFYGAAIDLATIIPGATSFELLSNSNSTFVSANLLGSGVVSLNFSDSSVAGISTLVFRAVSDSGAIGVYTINVEIREPIYVMSGLDTSLYSQTKDGSSWTRAYTDLNTALAAASSGDTLWVASGIYRTSGTTPFALKDGVRLVGGFRGYETLAYERDALNFPTILTADSDGDDTVDSLGITRSTSDISGTNADSVFTLPSGASFGMDGFIITGGDATSDGGGLSLNGGDVTLSRVQFIGNRSATYGGAFSLSNSTAMVINCLFAGNSSPQGGAVYATSSAFEAYNTAIFGNEAMSGNGGGLVALSSSDVDLIGCTVSGNLSTTSAGGVYLVDSLLDMKNTIVWGNVNGGFLDIDSIGNSTASYEYSLIAGLSPGGTNFSGAVNPLFTVPVDTNALPNSDADLTLSPTSPLVDQGTSINIGLDLGDFHADGTLFESSAHDVRGYGRVLGVGVDLGAYENSIVIYVDKNVSGGNGDGTSWANADPHLQSALRFVKRGVEIWVAQGTYYPDELGGENTGVSVSFTLGNKVKVYGGFAGTELALSERDVEANETILSGDIDQDDTETQIIGSNTLHVVSMENVDQETRLDGFTIKGGVSKFGGAVFNVAEARPVVANCRIEGNIVTSESIATNAILNEAVNAEFLSLSSQMFGAPVVDFSCADDERNLFLLTLDTYVGAQYQNVIFEDNKSELPGGSVSWGAYSTYYANSTLISCQFLGNGVGSNTNCGGPVVGFADRPRIWNTLRIAGNEGNDVGGMYVVSGADFSLVNSEISGNRGRTGGVYLFATREVTLANCTVTSNLGTDSSASTSGGVYVEGGSVLTLNVFNSVLLGNELFSALTDERDDIRPLSQNFNATGSFIGHGDESGEAASLTTAINEQFALVFPATDAPESRGDYSLTSYSELIDAGDQSVVTTGLYGFSNSLSETTDLAGNSRLLDNNVDVGAYEQLKDTVGPSLFLNAAVLNTNADNGTFNLNFDRPVSNLSLGDDIILTWNGTNMSGNAVLSGSGRDYTVDITNVVGSGVLEIEVVTTGDLVDTLGLGLSAPQSSAINFDFDSPVVSFTTDFSNGYANSDEVVFTVTFDEDVRNADVASHYVPSLQHSNVTVSGSGNLYTVTVSGISEEGLLFLSFSGNQNIIDFNGNAFVPPSGSTEGLIIDTTVPELTLLGGELEWYYTGVFTDSGVSITDSESGLTATIGGDAVNADVPGIYVITYDVSDSAGNTAPQVSRTVKITRPIYYVDADAPDGGDGASWATAYNKLQDALDETLRRNIEGADIGLPQEVWIAEGTYYPDEGINQIDGDRNSTFFLKNGISFYGGFDGSETSFDQRSVMEHITILSGDLDQDDTSIPDDDNAYHVVSNTEHSNRSENRNTVTWRTRIEGVTITNGNANGSNYPENTGGGLFSYGAWEYSDSLIVVDTVITNCSAVNGAGVSIFNNVVYDFENCVIQNNHASGLGGGIYLNDSFLPDPLEFSNTLRTQRLILEGTVVKNNSAMNGGGIAFDQSQYIDPTQNDSLVRHSHFFRGAILSGNEATLDGGAIYSKAAALNTGSGTLLISGNKAGQNGGGLAADNCEIDLLGVTIAGNDAGAIGGGIYAINGLDNVRDELRFVRALVWGNNANVSHDTMFLDALASYEYSLIEHLNPGGTNLDGISPNNAPSFVSPLSPSLAPNDGGDYQLTPNSIAISAGGTSFLNNTDVNGTVREVGTLLDIGAYFSNYIYTLEDDFIEFSYSFGSSFTDDIRFNGFSEWTTTVDTSDTQMIYSESVDDYLTLDVDALVINFDSSSQVNYLREGTFFHFENLDIPFREISGASVTVFSPDEYTLTTGPREVLFRVTDTPYIAGIGRFQFSLTTADITDGNPAVHIIENESLTNASEVSFRIYFNGTSSNVDLSDFEITTTGTVATGVPTLEFSGTLNEGDVYLLTVPVTGDGDISVSTKLSNDIVLSELVVGAPTVMIDSNPITIDQTAPTLVSVEYETALEEGFANTALLTFSEAVRDDNRDGLPSELVSSSNLTFTDNGLFSTIAPDAENTSLYTGTFQAELIDSSNTGSFTYDVPHTGVTDLAGNPLTDISSISANITVNSYDQWLDDNAITEVMGRGIEDDPDNDGVPTGIEFLRGTHPNLNDGGEVGYDFRILDYGGSDYPTITFSAPSKVGLARFFFHNGNEGNELELFINLGQGRTFSESYEPTNNLSDWGQDGVIMLEYVASPVIPDDLQALPNGWRYYQYRFSNPIDLTPKGFVRSFIEW